jgi:c-di-GMP-binding flagellar brake protein YcgR
MGLPRERRRHVRSEVTWPVAIETPETIISGRIRDISSGGAFINCETKLSPGETFRMVIHSESQPSPLIGEVEVVRTSLHGMGVRFHPEREAESKRP